jgi:hypothetical protein
MLDRLPTHLWVMAEVRRCNGEGIPAVIARRGEKVGGMVLLRLNRIEAGSLLLTEARDMEGRRGWMPALSGRLVGEEEAQGYIDRAVKRDPDLWVVEVEDRSGRNPFEGRILA